MARFVSQFKPFLFLCGLSVLALLFATWSPLDSFVATPKFWRDEAIPFEIARTFVELGSLDVVVTPGDVDGRPYLTHATGFPVTIPLAGVFAIFGISVEHARLYMIGWILATLFVTFFVARSFFGMPSAILASLLLATFAPFYANGRTMTGEIPGFLFLLVGLYFLYKRNSLVVGGVYVALAAVSKPSMYLLIIPVLGVEFFVQYTSRCIPKLIQIGLGTLPIMLLWIFLIVPTPFSQMHWSSMIELYRHPFNEESLLSKMPGAFIRTVFHTTILYIFLLASIVIYGAKHHAFVSAGERFFRFSWLFGIASGVYYLRSPGWLRYLLGIELLLLILLPVALFIILRRSRAMPVLIVWLLVLVQAVIFFSFSDIRSSTSSLEAAAFLAHELDVHPGATVGVVYDPPVAALVDPWRKYQIATIGGKETYGTHPLSLKTHMLPTYIIGYTEGHEDILKHFYMPLPEKPGGRTIYKKQ